ncbi:uncharacterized protein [Physcomitrium patens]|uniref:uncharacterized protein isoform X2 n=1 Tax=Physcomitrium patens TaxID=3218 RepID=UPI000D17DF36|nr:26S proteasome non-ATPase regulatory subunit 12-like isoform X2 [Physcomitrium patens]|eukprot:XP_024401315.1 26S proteasome non-ATPase regulatory subunit 12-like isoform X2 [Physcomitrella patens]
MMNVTQNEMDTGAIAIKEYLEDGRIEKVIQEQRVVAIQEKRLDAAIEELLKLETELRSTSDARRIQRVVVSILQLCYEAQAWKTLIKQIRFFSQCPDQLKQAVIAMVNQAVSYLNDIHDPEIRIELEETLNHVSSSKNLCRYSLSTPLEGLAGDRKSRLADLNMSALKLSCESREERGQAKVEERGQAKVEERGQELTTPDHESLPTTPPHKHIKEKDSAPSLCRAPRKKKTYLVRKPVGAVRRRLFGQVPPADVEDFLSELEQSTQQRFIDRYNFDPVKEKPLPGRFEWSPLRLREPHYTRPTSKDSSTDIQRSELAPLLSA